MARQRDRGQMVPKGTNRWLLKVYLGRDGKGKRRYSSKAFGGSTTEARVALTAMLQGVDTNTFVPTSKLTLGDYLDRWLKGKIDVSANTRTSYEHMLKHAKTHLGHLRVTELETLAVQQFVATLIAEKLSPRSVRYIVRVLRGALEDAVQDGVLARNPVKRVRLPQQVKRPASVLSIPQMNALLEKTANDSLGPLWRVLLTTGMRPQEAFALKWSDMSLEGCTISIARALISDGKGKTRLGDVKADSRRSVSVPGTTILALKAHKKEQTAALLKAGASYERSGLVFTNQFGRPLDISRVRRQWKAALKATKTPDKKPLPVIRLYDTRHTHLTQLLAGGLDLAFVSERAGHKDVAITAKHYAHVLPESRREIGAFTERMMQEGAKTLRK